MDSPQWTRRSYAVWAVAALGYGAGDTLTTLAVIADPRLVEANALVRGLFEAGGVAGVVAAKLLAFAIALALSVWVARGWRAAGTAHGPPAALAVVGMVLTCHNAALLL